MAEKWVVTAKKADFNAIGQKYNIDPVIARIIRNRDIIEDDDIRMFLNAGLESLHSPWLLKDMKKSINIVKGKIAQNKRIRIIGDYDIDGVCATYILMKGLEAVGAIVDTDIPDRMLDGYGINESLIDRAYESNVDTIITCDNGIAAIKQINYGKELGMTIIVTDHHDVPFEEIDGKKVELESNADAIINHKQSTCTYPFKNLCGAAVAYKFVEALLESMDADRECLEELLEFAAIATIGDVMDLQGENRIIVKEGLKRIHHTRNIGLNALIDINNLVKENINSFNIGFVIGPCINASGRLETAKIALRLFACKDVNEAQKIAGDLKALNDSRKDLTAKGVEKAIDLIENGELKNDKVLIVYLDDCHESIAGIIAGRIRERYNKPTIIFTDALDCAKGSGRSIEGYNMFEELSKFKDLFIKFGGHPMAAGLSLPLENVEVLRKALNEVTTLTDEDLIAKICIDVPMPIDYISERLVEQLDILEPFGKGNEKPLFADKNLNVLSGRLMGENKNMIKLKVRNQAGCSMDMIHFEDAQKFLDFLENKFGKEEVDKMMSSRENNIVISAVYYPSINEYRGYRSIQAIMKNYC